VGARFGLQSYLNSKDASGNHYAQLACCDGGLTNFFPGLASDLHLLDLFLLSSYDYRHEPLSWPISIYLYMCVCVCVCVFTFAKQALYNLSHSSGSFCSGYFGDGVSRSICLGWL
jgi:hypothetical protein